MRNLLQPRKPAKLGSMTTPLPLGPEVDPHPAKRPERVTLKGRTVTLAPLDPKAHTDALYAGAHGPEKEAIWAYLFPPPFEDKASFAAYIERSAASEDPLFYAILDPETGAALGHATLMRIDATHRVIETGNILYTPKLQRTVAATECMFLLMKYVFEELGYRRYEWKCNSLNAPSRRAALRLGFTFEGIFRQHMMVKGRNRDTAWYSMLDSEWPEIMARFERWLSPDNFDAAGKQKKGLAEA